MHKFRAAGFKVDGRLENRRGRIIDRVIITAPDEDVSVLYHNTHCFVGLANMTPEQSELLAQFWVETHDAKSNAEIGQRLTDHAANAWRSSTPVSNRSPDQRVCRQRVFIAAFKTWPQGAYHPGKRLGFRTAGVFPSGPGAAVKLNQFVTCT